MSLGIFSINDTVYFRANTVNSAGSATDATGNPTFAVYATSGTTTAATGNMTKVGSKTGFYHGNFSTAAASFSSGQYFILIEATVAGETPKAHVSFQLVTDERSVQEIFDEIQIIGDAVPILGSGTVSVDHNFGSTDAFRVTNGTNTPLTDVRIRAFVKSDYDAGRIANSFVVGESVTNTEGRWRAAIRLSPGNYTLEFSKPGVFNLQTSNITVT